MTNLEFSSQFDIFYNNISSNAAPPVDEYEKSVFLTKAQKDVVLGIYNGREIPGVSFESTEEARRYISNLVKEYITSPQDNESNIIHIPYDLWFIVNESAILTGSNSCIEGKEVSVVPIRYDYFNKSMSNPFRQPNGLRVLRTDIEGRVKLYSKYTIKQYKVIYIKTPEPIITESLDMNLTIEGKTESTTDVNEALHKFILERAVYLAKEAYIGNQNSK